MGTGNKPALLGSRISPAVIVLLFSLASLLEADENDSLSQVRKKGYVRICADPANLPFSSADSPTPGFEVELAQLIARELGVEARFQWILTYVRPVWDLRKGQCDVFMGLPPTARFKQLNPWVAVSRPYYTMTYAIVARTDAGIRDVADLAGKRVAVDAGRPAEYYLLEKGLQRGIYKRQEEVFQAVETGEAPAGLLPLPIANWLARGKPELRVILLGEPGIDVPTGVATRAEDRTLTEAIDAAVGRLLSSGAVQEVLLRYGAIPSRDQP